MFTPIFHTTLLKSVNLIHNQLPERPSGIFTAATLGFVINNTNFSYN